MVVEVALLLDRADLFAEWREVEQSDAFPGEAGDQARRAEVVEVEVAAASFLGLALAAEQAAVLPRVILDPRPPVVGVRRVLPDWLAVEVAQRPVPLTRARRVHADALVAGRVGVELLHPAGAPVLLDHHVQWIIDVRRGRLP